MHSQCRGILACDVLLYHVTRSLGSINKPIYNVLLLIVIMCHNCFIRIIYIHIIEVLSNIINVTLVFGKDLPSPLGQTFFFF